MGSSHKTDAVVGVEAAAPTLLLVDDDADTVHSLRLLLATEFPRVRIVATTSPEAALSILAGEPVDVLVADYRMPGLNGLALILRAHHLQPELPAFLITAYPGQELALVATEKARVEGFFPKPLDHLKFRESLQRVLGSVDAA